MTYKLYGFHPRYVGKDGIPYLILLENGSLRGCNSERKYREKLGDWTLGTYAKETDVSTTALQTQLDNFLKTYNHSQEGVLK